MKLTTLLTTILILTTSQVVYAQRAVMGLPVDNKGTPLIAALGLPSTCSQTVTTATYTQSCDVPANTGDNTGRMFRGIQIYNPSMTASVFVCLGPASGCLTDMIKIRPQSAVTQDFALYGPGNNVTKVWFRLSAPGSEVIDVNIW